MNLKTIKELLENYDHIEVKRYLEYINKLATEKDKKGKLKNYWITKKSDKELAWYFQKIKGDGETIDGVHITLQSTGISYDYVAYKNKMLRVYPETIMDFDLVYQNDEIKNIKKENGKVFYEHNIPNPFKDRGEMIGCYCVIKNKRGEFLTLLDRDDIDKHRRVAKTDFIWRQWFSEMALKTVVKKACKLHFSDIYEKIEETDNENYELDNPLNLDLSWKQKIDACRDLKELTNVYNEGKLIVENLSAFNKYIAIKKEQLNENT
jgi:hypothetical protein